MIHMLTIYRRHLKVCEHAKEGRKYRRCRCPIHVEGTLEGRLIRQSLETTNWQRATDIVHEWESKGIPVVEEAVTQPLIREACERFKADAAARKLAASTLKKYRVLTDQLVAFSDSVGAQYLTQLGIDEIRKFRESWKDGGVSSEKKLERLKSLYRFFSANGWTENHAKALRAPVVTDIPTLPFTREEMTSILSCVPQVKFKHERISHELHAFVLLLRYSGLRIGDASQLHESRIKGNRLLLYMAKTRVPVYVPLPDFVVHRLEFVKRGNGHYFCSGNAKTDSYTSKWRLRLSKVFKLAKIEDGHAHRFRDTFAVELLDAGVSIDQVSILLGHKSVRITEKHYAPWVKSRQAQLDAAVSAANVNETNHTYYTREVM